MKLSRNGRVAVARTVWIAVAILLLWRALPFLQAMSTLWGAAIALVCGIAIGWAKGRFVLRKSAVRTTRFIARRPERDWIWMSLHPVLYLLIPVMIALGIGIRTWLGPDYPGIVVAVYVGIAIALIFGSFGFSAGRPEPEPA